MIRLPKRITFRMTTQEYSIFCLYRREAGEPYWSESLHIREAIRRYIAPAQEAAARRASDAIATPRPKSEGKPAKRRTRSKK